MADLLIFHDVDGQGRATGLRPSPRAALEALPPFGEAMPTIPRSQWPTAPPPWAAELEAALPVLDQGSVGACASYALVGAFVRAMHAAGHTPRALDPRGLYARTNGGRDQGSTPTDNLDVATREGIGLAEDNPGGAYYKNRLPKDALRAASRFRADQGQTIGARLSAGDYSGAGVETATAELMTVLMQGKAAEIGIQLPAAFGSVGRDGKVPHGGFGGLHAMFLLYGWLDPASGGPLFRVRNSWSPRWGDNGCANLDPKHLFAGYFESCVPSVVLMDPSDPTRPPAPKG